jgi:phage terminase large subunit-like protein
VTGRRLSELTVQTLVEQIKPHEVEKLAFDWETFGRDAQKPPKGDWLTWLLIGGRGSGKTRAGAEWVRSLAANGVSPIALVGETIIEAKAVMIHGPSGILKVTPRKDQPLVKGHMLFWKNGVEAQVLGAADPERFRGPQFAAAWCDELGKWTRAEESWDNLMLSMRLGKHPRTLVTTTPRPTRLMRRLLADKAAAVTRMATKENGELARSFLEAIIARYEGTVLGRQELDGELIDDKPDALWNRRSFIPHDGTEAERIVVALDPPATAGRTSDAAGIVVAGRIGDSAVVLADMTFAPAPPLAWAERAVAAYREFSADCIIAEVNQGGDMVSAVLRQVDPDVPLRAARAKRGKWLRAEPVAALYARRRVRHAEGLTALEDEMCAFGADGLADGHSPDRVDALVWALTELLLGDAEPRIRWA